MAKKEIPENWLEVSSRAEWREWLENNHSKEQLVWLRIWKAGTGIPGVSLSEAVSEALCFGWIDGRAMSLDEVSYLLRLTPRRKGSLWSKVNKDRALTLIEQGLMTEAGYKAIEEAKGNGLWYEAYTSKEAPVLPDDLIEELNRDEEASANFSGWNNSDKSIVVFWIKQAKRKETREKRIRIIVECAHDSKKLDTSYLTGGGRNEERKVADEAKIHEPE